MAMKNLLIACVLPALFIACGTAEINVDAQLTNDEQTELTYRLSRYIARVASKADHQTKFNAEFDDYYRRESAKIYPKFYYRDAKTRREYFLVTHIAPSIHEKYVARAGYFIGQNEGADFAEYVEVFRTWKDLEDTLMPKAEMLFKKMIAGEDLTPYYPATAGIEYIEFPDADVYFDSEQRMWVSTRENPLQEMKDEAARALKEAGDAERQARNGDDPAQPE